MEYDETSSRIAYLEQKLEEAENNVQLSARYGKQLLEENHELHTKLEYYIKTQGELEHFEQEKHSLKLKLEASLNTEKILHQEIESMKEEIKKSSKLKDEAIEKFETQQKASIKQSNENQMIIDSLKLDLSVKEDLVVDLEQKLRDLQENLQSCNVSKHELSVNYNEDIMEQLNTAIKEKQDLDLELTNCKSKLNKSQSKLSIVNKRLQDVQQELEEKECQLTSYSNILEKNKEEMIDLQLQLDNIQLEQTDTNKKGNSLFSEVEDNRRHLEDQLAKLKINFDVVNKQNTLKTQQVNKMKIQIASLISLNSTKADQGYITNLQESVESYKQMIEDFKIRCRHLEEELKVVSANPSKAVEEPHIKVQNNMGNFFENRCKQYQKQNVVLEDQIQNLTFNKVVLNDRILQLQRELHEAKRTKDRYYSENIKLKIKFEELKVQKGIKPETKEFKTVVEKIPIEDYKKPIVEPENPPSDEIIVNKLEQSSVVKEETSKTEEEYNVANKENQFYTREKKIKKSVRLTETVDVKEENGLVSSQVLKDKNEVKKPIKKTYKKLEVQSEGPSEECKQQ